MAGFLLVYKPQRYTLPTLWFCLCLLVYLSGLLDRAATCSLVTNAAKQVL